MVVGVIQLAGLSQHDSSCSAVAGARTRHCKFPVVAAFMLRQTALEVAEDHAVFLIGIGSALPDQRNRLTGFPGKFGGVDRRHVALTSACAGQRHCELCESAE